MFLRTYFLVASFAWLDSTTYAINYGK